MTQCFHWDRIPISDDTYRCLECGAVFTVDIATLLARAYSAIQRGVL